MDWKKLVIATGILGCSLIFLWFAIAAKLVVLIGPDERGVVQAYGAPAGYPKVLMPGPHLLSPAESAVIYKLSPETYTTLSKTQGAEAILSRSSEGDNVLVHVSATYAINSEQVLDLYTSWQDRYKEELVRPLTRQTVRKTLSQYTASEIEVNRAGIERSIFAALKQKFAGNYLILLDFKIINIQSYD